MGMFWGTRVVHIDKGKKNYHVEGGDIGTHDTGSCLVLKIIFIAALEMMNYLIATIYN